MTSLFGPETHREPDPAFPRVAGLVCAAIGFFLNAVDMAMAISHSRSSTAVIGYIFLPFISALVSVPCFVLGWCAGYFFTWRQSKIDWRRLSALAAGIAVLLMVGVVATALWRGNDLQNRVHRIQTMQARELDALMNGAPPPTNKFVLGAVAANTNAPPSALHRIAMSDDPQLHERMGSFFDVLGTNRRGLAVMRLVAANPHTAAPDLEKLAWSNNEDVLGDVAANAKLSEALCAASRSGAA